MVVTSTVLYRTRLRLVLITVPARTVPVLAIRTPRSGGTDVSLRSDVTHSAIYLVPSYVVVRYSIIYQPRGNRRRSDEGVTVNPAVNCTAGVTNVDCTVLYLPPSWWQSTVPVPTVQYEYCQL